MSPQDEQGWALTTGHLGLLTAACEVCAFPKHGSTGCLYLTAPDGKPMDVRCPAGCHEGRRLLTEGELWDAVLERSGPTHLGLNPLIGRRPGDNGEVEVIHGYEAELGAQPWRGLGEHRTRPYKTRWLALAHLLIDLEDVVPTGGRHSELRAERRSAIRRSVDGWDDAGGFTHEDRALAIVWLVTRLDRDLPLRVELVERDGELVPVAPEPRPGPSSHVREHRRRLAEGREGE